MIGMAQDRTDLVQSVTFDGPDGEVRLSVSQDGETLWATRSQIANTFGCTEKNVFMHIQKIYEDGELEPGATSKKSLLVQNEGGRPVKRQTDIFNLDVMLSVGYRVNSARATKFRQWATQTLKALIIHGYALDESRLSKDLEAQQDLAKKLRAIRTEEKNLFRKVTDVFKATASDYNDKAQAARSFFAMAQDKFHFAITGKTAAEIVLERANSQHMNMGMRSIAGDMPSADESRVAKNYLNERELEGLENICEQFMLFAESKAFRGQKMTMEEISHKLNTLLTANDYPVLYEYKSFLRDKADSVARMELERYRARIGPAKTKPQIAGGAKKSAKGNL